MRRLVMVLEYEVADLQGDALDRIAAVLRERGVHDPIEGARQVQATVTIGEPADQLVDVLRGGPA